MSSSSYNWGAWAHITHSSGSDVDSVNVNDTGSVTSDEISLDGVAAMEISVQALEDNTGACDGNINVYVLGEAADGWQDGDDDIPLYTALDMEQNTTKRDVFAVNPAEYGSIKIYAYNDCGQEVALTIQKRTATLDTAA